MKRKQRGKGIFLGKPVGIPETTGIFIGKPGLLVFKGSDIMARESLVLDLTNLTVDLTNQQVQFHA